MSLKTVLDQRREAIAAVAEQAGKTVPPAGSVLMARKAQAGLEAARRKRVKKGGVVTDEQLAEEIVQEIAGNVTGNVGDPVEEFGGVEAPDDIPATALIDGEGGEVAHPDQPPPSPAEAETDSPNGNAPGPGWINDITRRLKEVIDEK